MTEYKQTLLDLPSGTKRCPYCAELILSAAIKCRYCGEFLNRAAKKDAQTSDEKSQDETKKDMLFEISPSLWLLTPSFLKMAIVLTVSYFLAFWQAKQLFEWMRLSTDIVSTIEKYRVVVGLSLAAAAAVVFLFKIIKLKSVRYRITPDRIEWTRGLLQRRVDNIDMFRIVDMKMQRSLSDIMVGIGSITLITTDKTDPEFKFEKVGNSKRLYDAIKKSSLDADSKRSVVHLE